jgi:hypothetical protein
MFSREANRLLVYGGCTHGGRLLDCPFFTILGEQIQAQTLGEISPGTLTRNLGGLNLSSGI